MKEIFIIYSIIISLIIVLCVIYFITDKTHSKKKEESVEERLNNFRKEYWGQRSEEEARLVAEKAAEAERLRIAEEKRIAAEKAERERKAAEEKRRVEEEKRIAAEKAEAEEEEIWEHETLQQIEEWDSFENTLTEVQHSINRPSFYIPQKEQPLYKKVYNELLQGPKWQEFRDRILTRDSYQCVYCGNMWNLQVHHKYYSKYPNGRKVDPWNYPETACITLCADCHKRAHAKKKIKVYYRKYTDNYGN